MIEKKGHGNGKTNHRTWNYKINFNPEYFGCNHEFVKTKFEHLLMCKHCTKTIWDYEKKEEP